MASKQFDSIDFHEQQTSSITKNLISAWKGVLNTELVTTGVVTAKTLEEFEKSLNIASHSSDAYQLIGNFVRNMYRVSPKAFSDYLQITGQEHLALLTNGSLLSKFIKVYEAKNQKFYPLGHYVAVKYSQHRKCLFAEIAYARREESQEKSNEQDQDAGFSIVRRRNQSFAKNETRRYNNRDDRRNDNRDESRYNNRDDHVSTNRDNNRYNNRDDRRNYHRDNNRDDRRNFNRGDDRDDQSRTSGKNRRFGKEETYPTKPENERAKIVPLSQQEAKALLIQLEMTEEENKQSDEETTVVSKPSETKPIENESKPVETKSVESEPEKKEKLGSWADCE